MSTLLIFLLVCPVTEPICTESTTFEDVHRIDSTVWRMSDAEEMAIEIIMSGAIGKEMVDILPVDCGASGAFHLQPSNPLDLPEPLYQESIEVFPYTIATVPETSCAIDDEIWVLHLEDALYSPYGPGMQLKAWRRIVRPCTYGDWSDEEQAAAWAMANSLGGSGCRRLAEEVDHDVFDMIDAYLAQRPDSGHRARRAERMRDLLWD